LVLEIIKSAAQKKYSSSELVHKLKGALATILTKNIMFWKLVNSFTMMKSYFLFSVNLLLVGVNYGQRTMQF
jgi:hypothetical protein